MQSENESLLGSKSLIAEENDGFYATLCDDKEVEQAQSLTIFSGDDSLNEKEIVKNFLLAVKFEDLEGKYLNANLFDKFSLDKISNEDHPVNPNPMLEEVNFCSGYVINVEDLSKNWDLMNTDRDKGMILLRMSKTNFFQPLIGEGLENFMSET